MSGLLFLFFVAGFVLIAYWAYRNDAMGLQECGSGLLALRAAAPKTKPLPKWKKTTPVSESPRRANRLKAAAGRKPGWKRTLLYDAAR